MSGRHWKKKGIPHVGWSFVRLVELDRPSHTCEMCDKQHLRRYEVLRHEEYPEELKVGLNCSEAMRLPFKNGLKFPSINFLMILQFDDFSPFLIAKSHKPDFINKKFGTQADAVSYILEHNLH